MFGTYSREQGSSHTAMGRILALRLVNLAAASRKHGAGGHPCAESAADPMLAREATILEQVN
jgi:hypothetical protein